MTSSYYQNFTNKILDNSCSKIWQTAVLEWKITNMFEEEDASEQCICGKENIRYCYEISNVKTGKKLCPIGSCCIKKFEREDLKDEISVYEKMFVLLHELEQNNFIEFSSKFFSRKLLKYLYENGAFQPNEHNSWRPEKDYQMLLDMFNRRNERTPRQEQKIRAIIVSSIKPFLYDLLGDKIIRHH